MSTEIVERYRRRADRFEALITGVPDGAWESPSPCAEWTVRDVVGHILDMHGVVFQALDRELSAGPALADDPLGAFRAARADVEALLADTELAAMVHDTPGGRRSVADHVDGVPSADLVLHGWDLARATGQDDTMDPDEVEVFLPGLQQLPPEMWIPDAFGPGVVVFGPEFPVPADAPAQQRLIGLIGRDPEWKPA